MCGRITVVRAPSAMKIGYARVSTIEQNLAWHLRLTVQADVQQSQEIDAGAGDPIELLLDKGDAPSTSMAPLSLL